MDDFRECLSNEHFISQAPVIVYLGFISIFGCLGNGLSLYVYATNFHSSNAKCFLVFLSSMELFSCLVMIPMEIFYLHEQLNFPDNGFCEIFVCVKISQVMVSSIVLVLIGFDRWRKVCHPFGWQLSLKLSKCLCCALLAVGFVVAIPSMFLWGVQYHSTSSASLNHACPVNMTSQIINITLQYCSLNRGFPETMYTIPYAIVFILGAFIGIGSLGVMYWHIIRTVRQQEMKRTAKFNSELAAGRQQQQSRCMVFQESIDCVDYDAINDIEDDISSYGDDIDGHDGNRGNFSQNEENVRVHIADDNESDDEAVQDNLEATGTESDFAGYDPETKPVLTEIQVPCYHSTNDRPYGHNNSSKNKVPFSKSRYYIKMCENMDTHNAAVHDSHDDSTNIGSKTPIDVVSDEGEHVIDESSDNSIRQCERLIPNTVEWSPQDKRLSRVRDRGKSTCSDVGLLPLKTIDTDVLGGSNIELNAMELKLSNTSLTYNLNNKPAIKSLEDSLTDLDIVQQCNEGDHCEHNNESRLNCTKKQLRVVLLDPESRSLDSVTIHSEVTDQLAPDTQVRENQKQLRQNVSSKQQSSSKISTSKLCGSQVDENPEQFLKHVSPILPHASKISTSQPHGAQVDENPEQFLERVSPTLQRFSKFPTNVPHKTHKTENPGQLPQRVPHKEQRSSKISTNVTRIMLVITTTSMICFIPYVLLSLLRSLTDSFDMDISGTRRIVYNIFLRSFFLKSVINPIVYGSFDTRFRNVVYKMFFYR